MPMILGDSVMSLAVAAASTIFQPTIDFGPATNASGDEATWFNPADGIRGHRGILDGSFAAVVFIHTLSEADRALQQATYNARTRRSFDGGQTWSAPRNISGISGFGRLASAPRIVATPGTIPSGDSLDVRNESIYLRAFSRRPSLRF